MINSSFIYVPARIKQARVLRCLTQTELAEKINVTKGAISQYENGTIQPKASTMGRISMTLGFPLAFFCASPVPQLATSSAVFFRQKSARSKQNEAATETISLVYELVEARLKNYIDFLPNRLPTNLELKDSYTLQDCEEYAAHLRAFWKLDDGPIDNLFDVVQENGIFISQIDLPNTKIDAFSCLYNGLPIIVMEANRSSSVRRRYSLAHELGHLLLHSDRQSISAAQHKQLEQEAWWFAGAFMMPQTTFFRDLYAASLDHLLYLKKKWKVSISAMIERCYACDVFTDEQRQNLYKKLNYRKWRSVEPYDDICDFEHPYVLRQALELIISNKLISATDFDDSFCLPWQDVSTWCNAAPELLSPPARKPVQLHLIK